MACCNFLILEIRGFLISRFNSELQCKMKIQYKGADIHFWVHGTGKPLVLLHGFLETVALWKNLVPELSKTRQIICIDLPGHGKSGGISEVHSMEEMAFSVKAVLDKLEIQEFSLAGHSMGGYVGLELLKNFPMLLKGIVLINSTPLVDSAERLRMRDRGIQLVAKNKKAFVSMAISNLLDSESSAKFQSEMEDLKQNALKMSIKNIQAAIKGMKIRTNLLPVLKDSKSSKIIVAGLRDKLIECSELKRVSKKSGSLFISMDGGHILPIENQNRIQKIVLLID